MSEHDFFKNWNINKQEMSATHKSGLGFQFEPQGTDGNPRIKLLNAEEWFKKCQENNLATEDCFEACNKLRSQFITIYNEVILPAHTPQPVRDEVSR